MGLNSRCIKSVHSQLLYIFLCITRRVASEQGRRVVSSFQRFNVVVTLPEGQKVQNCHASASDSQSHLSCNSMLLRYSIFRAGSDDMNLACNLNKYPSTLLRKVSYAFRYRRA